LVGLAVRVTLAGILVLLGALLAAGSLLEVVWTGIHPWAGRAGRPLPAVGYAGLTAALLAAPSVAWWFLLPRIRWLGIVLTVGLTACTFAAFTQ
jgi:hypothetical protein